MTIQGNKLIADEGKVLRRTVAYPLTGNTITLGKVLIDGELVDDKAEYYEEIDKPAKFNNYEENRKQNLENIS